MFMACNYVVIFGIAILANLSSCERGLHMRDGELQALIPTHRHKVSGRLSADAPPLNRLELPPQFSASSIEKVRVVTASDYDEDEWEWQIKPGPDPRKGWRIYRPDEQPYTSRPGSDKPRWMPGVFRDEENEESFINNRRLSMKLSGNVFPEGERERVNGRCCSNITDPKQPLPNGMYKALIDTSNEWIHLSTDTHSIFLKGGNMGAAKAERICASIPYECCSESHVSALLEDTGVWHPQEVLSCMESVMLSSPEVKEVVEFDDTWQWSWTIFEPSFEADLPEPGENPDPELPEIMPFTPGIE